jgi:subtilisin family serine protease
MELGKNPGFDLDKLHSSGITGKGVSIAIIDQALLVDHEEYKDNLKMYEEIHWPSDKNDQAQMHGSAVTSIAVGKTVGVAPGADLYYIAEQHGDFKNNNFDWTLHG